AVGTLYNCSSSVSGDLSNASPSGESLIACVTGEDLWYSFTALTPGVRIQVISNQNNIVIELQDMNGNLIDSENINGSLGNEILNFGGLTPGNQYLVAIRNFNSSQGIGTFSLCISKLIQTTCDYPGPNFSLCDWYKADYTGAHAYVFHFTPMDGGDAITVTKYGSTILPLTNVPGLQYEHDYQVTIDAVYQLTNGLLQPEFVTVAGSSVCDLNVGSPNLPGLRTNDQCPNMKTLYSYIQLTPGVCGASTYAWEVTRVDIPQLPVVVNTINSKFLQLKSTNGFVAGGVYNVRVSAVFGNNPPMHYGPVQCVQIVGSAGLTLEQEELTIEDSKNQDSDFVIFPNPTSSELNILPFVALNETVNIELLDQMGKIVYSESIYNLDGSIINVELPKEIASGLYLLHIENGDMSYQKKIVIEK
ncbi:MAG: Secretion system C-terminal sorting domain, partial [Bacteroidota bacterium]